MEKQNFDYVLVPMGFLVLFAYHLWLLHKIVKHPTKTVIGVNSINRRLWVQAMMEEMSKNGVLAVQSLRNNIMASTLLASTAIMLCSLIAVLMTSDFHGNAASFLVFGSKTHLGSSIKFFSILVCFLLAFLLSVQSVRYYSHASILINVPLKKMSPCHRHQDLAAEYVANTVNRGSYFWSLGLRAFYFCLPLFLWIFGPIPMFLSCLLLVLVLYFLDVTCESGWTAVVTDDEAIYGDLEHGRTN